jgi:N-acetylglucosamine-6-phosphate deacetylase
VSTASDLVITHARIAIPDAVIEDGWLSVHKGLISKIGRGAPAAGNQWNANGQTLVPGFVDMHCHGGGGGSFTTSKVEDALKSIATHRKHGTTTLMASLVSDSIPHLENQISALKDLVHEGELSGIHLEGPFISALHLGAHDPRFLLEPDPLSIKKLLNAGDDTVRMVTLAPELPGGVAAVRQLVTAGVIAAIGHTDGREKEIRPAIDAGATVATHLFNGMRMLHHREPGPIGTLLDDERVTVELICDLVHVHPTVLRLAARYAGRGRTTLVTDAMAATDANDGNYRLGTMRVEVQGGVAKLLSSEALAGSTLTMDVAFRNSVLIAGVPLLDAVYAASTRPAELLGIDKHTGSLISGLAADLVVLDEDLRLQRVLRGGVWV